MATQAQVEANSSRTGRDADLRDARPDRGADVRRPRRGDGSGCDFAARLAAGFVRAAGARVRRPLHRQPGHEPDAVPDRGRGGGGRRPARAAAGRHDPARQRQADARHPAGVRRPVRPRRRGGGAGRGGGDRTAGRPPVDPRAAGRQPGRDPRRAGDRACRSGPTCRCGCRRRARSCTPTAGWSLEADAAIGVAAGGAGDDRGAVHRRHPADDRGQLLGAGYPRPDPARVRRRRVVPRHAARPGTATGVCFGSWCSPAACCLSKYRLGWRFRAW